MPESCEDCQISARRLKMIRSQIEWVERNWGAGGLSPEAPKVATRTVHALLDLPAEDL